MFWTPGFLNLDIVPNKSQDVHKVAHSSFHDCQRKLHCDTMKHKNARGYIKDATINAIFYNENMAACSQLIQRKEFA